VTWLPEQAGNAALLFDPTSVEHIAKAMHQMATDEQLRATLRQRGKERIRLFTWERTARAYRALYRKVAGYPISKEDELLLCT
jgi:glycosyltransferase involved in cell wall biosynthesis